MALTITDSQKVSFSAVAVDAAGIADPNAKIAYSIDNPAILTLTDNGDGSGEVAAAGVGTATLTATATDPDGNSVSGFASVTVTGGDAVGITINFGAPVAK